MYMCKIYTDVYDLYTIFVYVVLKVRSGHDYSSMRT